MSNNPNLIPYRVMLQQEKGDKFQIAFDCQAEDDDHAVEQAENAYPNGEINTYLPFDHGGTELPMDSWLRTLAPGDEVWWNDPHCGLSSGIYKVAGINSENGAVEACDTVLQLKNDAGSEAEVFASELAPSQPEGLYPVVDGDDGNGDIYGYARTKDEAIDVGNATFADGVVDGYLAENVTLRNGTLIPMAWVALTRPLTTPQVAPDWQFVMRHFGLDDSFQWSDEQMRYYSALYLAQQNTAAATQGPIDIIDSLDYVKDVLREVWMALDNASGIVDPGEGEERAYQGPLARLKALRRQLEDAAPTQVQTVETPRFFKTVFRVEVLSEDFNVSDMGLHGIADAITTGSCSGIVECISVQGLSAQDAAAALITHGSDPVFFGIDDEKTGPVEDPVIAVRSLIDGDYWTEWRISQNLTDRWGVINDFDAANKPLRELQTDPVLLQRLRRQMWDEITFITRMNGQWGLLFEVEYCSIESETREAQAMGETTNGLKPHAAVIAALKVRLRQLEPEFPGVSFGIPHESQVVDNRPAAWAFVPDGLLDEDQRARLGKALLDF